jgi:hypothetical protein
VGLRADQAGVAAVVRAGSRPLSPCLPQDVACIWVLASPRRGAAPGTPDGGIHPGSRHALKAAAARKPAPVRVRAPGLTTGAWERLIPYDSHWGMMTWLLRASMRTSQPAASRGRYQAAGLVRMTHSETRSCAADEDLGGNALEGLQGDCGSR